MPSDTLLPFPESNPYVFRPAEEQDLPQMVRIYNESILSGNITAHTEPLSAEDMKLWLEKHLNRKWPAWVMLKEKNIIGFCSLNVFYDRPAYDITSEISLYIEKEHTGKKGGQAMLKFLENEAQKRNIRNLLAFIFEENRTAIEFFSKFGFHRQGFLPDIAQMPDGTFRNLSIFRKTLKHD